MSDIRALAARLHALAAAEAERDALRAGYDAQAHAYADCIEQLQAMAAERDALRALLTRARRHVEQDAQMMADLTRHSPLDPESQAAHDATEYESERLLPLIDAALRGEAE